MGKKRASITDIFKGLGLGGGQAAPVSAPAPAAAEDAPPAIPAPVAPARLYEDYETFVAPLLDALRDLPRDAEGMEFFIRADVVNDSSCAPEDRRIDVWVFYTRETDSRKTRQRPDPGSHFISLQRKDSDPENPRYDILLELSARPVLRLSVRPHGQDGQIESSRYVERYEAPQPDRKYNVYIGNYGLVIDTTDRRRLAGLPDFSGVLGEWIAEVAGARAPGVLAALAAANPPPQKDIAVLKPLRLKRKPPAA